MQTIPIKKTFKQRFWEKVKIVHGKDSCWEWTACISDGYGTISTRKPKRNSKAHRICWELLFGPIPEGLCVFHRCNNRKCVRPSHLFLGVKGNRSSTRQRFWGKVKIVHDRTSCWEWQGSLSNGIYGNFNFNDKTKYAHRVSWEFVHKRIPCGLHVLHRCDNPKCVRPSHLFLGTHQDNIKDMVVKDRNAYGERCSFSKLTENQVKEIRRSPETLKALAKKYNISFQQISRIKNMENWKHVQ